MKMVKNRNWGGLMSRMTHERALFSNHTAMALLIAVLFVQLVPLANACMLQAPGIAMALAGTEMPDDCASLNKNTCLMAFLQADQAPGSKSFLPGSSSDIALAPAPIPVRGTPYVAIIPWGSTPHCASPPARVLFCRMLN